MAMHFHGVVLHVERDIRHVQEIVREILLDQITAVPKAHHEVVYPVPGINLHDVPEDRLAAYLDHRLRAQVRFFADPRTQPARQYDDFQIALREAVSFGE